MDAEDYVEGWKHLVKKGVTSYLDALDNLSSGRYYHRQRSLFRYEDDDPSRFSKIEIPLFWGTF